MELCIPLRSEGKVVVSRMGAGGLRWERCCFECNNVRQLTMKQVPQRKHVRATAAAYGNCLWLLLIASFSADEQIFHLCGDSLMQKQLCLKYVNTRQKSVNQGQSCVVVYPLCGACELKLFTEPARVLRVSPGWSRDQSACSSLSVVLQQQRKDGWM